MKNSGLTTMLMIFATSFFVETTAGEEPWGDALNTIRAEKIKAEM